MENAPLLSAVAVPKEEEPLKRVTVEFASAVPEIVGVESLVKEEEVNNGTSGAVAAAVIVRAGEAEAVEVAEAVASSVHI